MGGHWPIRGVHQLTVAPALVKHVPALVGQLSIGLSVGSAGARWPPRPSSHPGILFWFALGQGYVCMYGCGVEKMLGEGLELHYESYGVVCWLVVCAAVGLRGVVVWLRNCMIGVR